MSTKRVTFAYSIGELVMLKDVSIPATVVRRADYGNHVHGYYCVWWFNGERRDEWVYEFELRGAVP